MSCKGDFRRAADAHRMEVCKTASPSFATTSSLSFAFAYNDPPHVNSSALILVQTSAKAISANSNEISQVGVPVQYSYR